MADLMNRTKAESLEVERFKVTFTDDELAALRANPYDFLKRTLEDKGHTVNHVMIDAQILSDDFDCPGGWEAVHLLNPPGYQSTWGVRCLPVM